MSSRVGGIPTGDSNQLLDPELVQKIVDELKSQGTFDQFRKDCMAEVDTKPGYQNLRQRVCHSLNKFLDRQQWKPTQNKNQLRNQLRKHIEDSGIMENGVRRIVDQVVNPKILSVIEPEVEYVMYNILGVEKPSNNTGDIINGNDEKASNVSSEDIEMRSVHDHSDEDDRKKKMEDSPSSSPNMAGVISPLTPERKKESPELRGNISPLTPPPALPKEDPGSPHTPPLPPLPPPMYMPPPPQLSDFVEDPPPPPPPPLPPLPTGSMSPVSDTELADLSPPEDSPETPSSECGLLSPPPPLPPSPTHKRPPSPLTSPIGSSPDIRTPPLPPPPPPPLEQPPLPASSGHSDISDTDLPCASSEEKSSDVDIEDLEKAREAILAKMAEASLSKDDSDEGEIHTEDDDYDSKKGREESEEQAQLTESDMSPISDESSSQATSKKEKKGDDHDESKKWESKAYKTSSDEDDSKPSLNTASSSKFLANEVSSKAEESNKKSSSDQSSTSREDGDRQHHHRHRHNETKYEKRSSSSSSSSGKDKHKEKSIKDLKKMEKIEQKVNKAFKLKSDKFKDIDMFAPKAPKPKPPLHRPPSSASNSSSGASPLPSFGNKSPLPSFGAAKSPLSWGSKTPPTFGSPNSSCSAKSPLNSTSPKNNVQSKTTVPVVKANICKKQVDSTPSKASKELPQKYIKELPSGHVKFSATIIERTKVYPELPVSKSGTDKVKQRENDIADSKRRLEEARARRIKEQQKEEHLRKTKKNKHDKFSRSSKTDSDSDDIDWESKASRKEEVIEIRKRRSSSSSCEFKSSRSRNNSVKEDVESFHGFLSKGLNSLETRSSVLKQVIEEDEESLETEDSDENETISIKGLSNPESVAALLKKHFGGNPRVVHQPPSWLEHKLKEWCVPFEDIGIMTFTKPSNNRKSKWKFLTEHKFTIKRKLISVDAVTKPKRAKVKKNLVDDAVCQLEREMNAIHSDKPSFWISDPFHGFETSDLLPPSLEPKSSFLQTDVWTQEMKTIDSKKEFLKTFSADLYEEYDEDLSTEHALNLIIKPNFDHEYLEHELPTSPSSLDSDDKGSSSPSSSKENMEEHTLRKKSKFSSNKSVNEKSVIPRTRRNVPVLKKVAS